MPRKYTPRRPKVTRLCAHCGSLFSTAADRADAQFCRMQCYNDARKSGRIPQRCRECGAALTATPSVAAKGRGVFCGLACYRAHVAAAQRTCAHCAQAFSPFESSGRFCSLKCYWAWRRMDWEIRYEAHFWERVHKTETCWAWTAARDAGGYGLVSDRTKGHTSAHRMAWELTFGPIPPGQHVLHHCDNPPCVRPDHLHLGDHDQNMGEASERERFPMASSWRESHAGHALRLTAEQIPEIRARYARGGVSYSQLAAEYRVGKSTIESVVTRHTWADIP